MTAGPKLKDVLVPGLVVPTVGINTGLGVQ